MKIERTSNMVNMLDEVARNHNIVLQWRINKIASWMSLKSSENIPESSVQYWNILFAPPPAKHAFHRLSDQWVDCVNGFWRFSFFSRNEPLHRLLDVLSVNDEENKSLTSKYRTRRENVSLVQYQSNFFFPWEWFLMKGQQVLFYVVLLLPLIGLQFFCIQL